MSPAFVTKILSLAAAVTLVTLCVLVAVPKNAGGKLGRSRTRPRCVDLRRLGCPGGISVNRP